MRSMSGANFAAVELPRVPSYGFYVAPARALFQIERRPAPGTTMMVPALAGGDAFSPLAKALLLLPFDPTNQPSFVGVEIERGLGHLWREHPDTGLTLTTAAISELNLDRSFGATLLATPTNLGVCTPADVLSRVAWWVLCQAPIEQVIRVCLGLALRLDVLGHGLEWEADLAADVSGRMRHGVGLVAAARGGRSWLNPRCLRWIARELAAAHVAKGEEQYAHSITWAQSETLALTELFPDMVLERRAPGPEDLVKACWLLGEVYEVDEGPETGEEAVGWLARLMYSPPNRDSLARRFGSWLMAWSVPDDHGLWRRVGWGSFKPSELRERFQIATGLTPQGWLGGAFLVASASWMNVLDGTAHMMFPDHARHAVDGEPIDARVTDLIEIHGASTCAQVGREVLRITRERGRPYGGLGSTPQAEYSAFHERPVVVLSDGAWAISSFEAYTRWAIQFVRAQLSTGRGSATPRAIGSTVGRMFEAAVHDIACTLRPRHTVIGGDEIDSVSVPGLRRGDLIVAQSDQVVVFEVGLQPVRSNAALGSRVAVDDLLRRYAIKTEQARETVRSNHVLNTLLPPSLQRAVTCIHIVDEPLPLNPMQARRLQDFAPGVPGRFVIGVDEFVDLVELSHRGWSLPSLVFGWLYGADDVPLSRYLTDHALRFTATSRLVGREHLRLLFAHAARRRDAAA